MSDLKLAHGLKFEDLYNEESLARVDAAFLGALKAADKDLADRLAAGRANPGGLDRKATADLLLAVAPHADAFLGELFGIQKELAALITSQKELADLFECKRLFIQRKASKAVSEADSQKLDGAALEATLKKACGGKFDQLTYARNVMKWMAAADANAANLDAATKYACWALYTDAGQHKHKADVLFLRAGKMDHMHLVHYKTIEIDGISMFEQPDGHEFYHRDGFNLTDLGTDIAGALDQTNYCVFCHDRGRDFCSKGMPDKETGKIQKNPLGVKMEGCPLEEKISEFHVAKTQGYPAAALAIICSDNPMVAATGHRICNDCMKSCIYQKQVPVNIPQVETRTLKDVLNLPWGFEVYSLLTRWNPMNLRRPVPKPQSNYKVLVVGAGPAGYSTSHFLMNEGHNVYCVDGLKIEPLAPELGGVDQMGNRVPFRPIKNVQDLWEPLDERCQAGFGGVAEYGITVRWDKNFLKVVRLLVERRKRFDLYGGTRFGSAITAESAFEMGFDHVALCMGAGKPTFLEVPNGLARGVRQASDFLMALQLTGAAKKDTIANLQVRLPAVIIGGGLTAIDAATEVLSYYVRQVEKFAQRYDILVKEKGEKQVRAAFNEEDGLIANEWLAHARQLAAERAKAAKEGRQPDFIPLLNSWGGATIAYRRKMTGAPSYQLNHEEIEKAFEQGMRFAELLAPKAVNVDKYGHADSIVLERQMLDEKGRPKATGETVTMKARSILIAAGTQPNTVLSREWPGFSKLDGKYFQAFTEDGQPITPEWSAKPKDPVFVISPRDDGRCMSFFGDLHPSFAGNVVKALASGKQGYPTVDRMLAKVKPSPVSPAQMTKELNISLRPTVHAVTRLTPNVIEVTLKAPLCAEMFQPGQFFRLQNFEANSVKVGDTTMAMEGVALTGAIIDKEQGLVSLIALEMGGSTNLISTLKPGERVVLMGPTGAPTHTHPDQKVLLLGGGLGNAVLLTIHKAYSESKSKVLYFAAYKTMRDRFHIDLVEKYSDVVVWCCDEAPGFKPTRPQDKTFVGNIVQAMLAYAKGELGPVEIPLMDIDHMVVIGSDLMMNAVRKSRFEVLKDVINPKHTGIASINSPMQCMMKEICAQCLQPHTDPETGKEEVVFSCFNQDQPIDRVNFPALRERLCQNQVQEKVTRLWIDHCMPEVAKVRPRV